MGLASKTCAVVIAIFAVVMLPAGLPEGRSNEVHLPIAPSDIIISEHLGEVPYIISDCSVSGLEGTPITLDASCVFGPPSSGAKHRWDLDSDGTWDTSWLSADKYNHTWGDDYNGSAHVARGIPTEGVDIVVEGELHETGGLGPSSWVAQTFVPSKLLLTKVAVDVSINWGSPSDLHAWIRDSLDISGTNLSHGSIPYTKVPTDRFIRPDQWPIIDMSDATLQVNHTYYLILNTLTVGNGSYEVHGVGLVRPEWPAYAGCLSMGWMQDPDDNLGFRTYSEDFSTAAEGDIDVRIENVDPVASGFPSTPLSVPENSLVNITASATDIGSDDLTFIWDWGDGTSDDVATYYNDGLGPDPPNSPGGTYPFLGTDAASHIYGDDGIFRISLTVYDDDGGSVLYQTNVTVLNVLPSGTLSILSVEQHEASVIQFSAHITDPGSDDIFLKWTWGYGAPDEYSTYYNNGVSPDQYPSPDIHPRDMTDVKSHTYGDNGAFMVSVFVRDDDSGSNGTTFNITATPDNLPPKITVSGGMSIDEGQSVSLTAVGEDPGSDDLTFKWDWGEGSTDSKTYYNDGVGPDPSNSPGGTYPFAATDTATHLYGDNGAYVITLTLVDDDGGSVTWSGQLMVINLPPAIQPFGPFSFDEGSLLSVNATATDPGSDDLTFTWSFELGPTVQTILYNDGVGPDPPRSPGGIYPFTATASASHPYGDNGVYNLALTVTDDDGGATTYTTNITVVNLPPTITPFGPFTVNEGDPLTVMTNAVDAGSDDLIFAWTFEYGPTVPHVFYNDGTGPDPAKSPNGTFPFSVDDMAAHTYGDNGVFKITLTVRDDDGGIESYETTVTVLNLPPAIFNARAFVVADFTLRVAGEKWHDVILRLYENGTEIGYAQVIRYPGSPNEQMATIHDVQITLGRTFSAVAYFTPFDDPINGQINGANPASLIITWENGNETVLHHTFNVVHNDTWMWSVDKLHIPTLNQRIHFEATAHDPGSDDLTFTWSFGDGSPDASAIYYNNGVDPDVHPSPDVNPITVTDRAAHIYSMVGVYTVILTVTDDDGGEVTISFAIAVG